MQANASQCKPMQANAFPGIGWDGLPSACLCSHSGDSGVATLGLNVIVSSFIKARRILELLIRVRAELRFLHLFADDDCSSDGNEKLPIAYHSRKVGTRNDIRTFDYMIAIVGLSPFKKRKSNVSVVMFGLLFACFGCFVVGCSRVESNSIFLAATTEKTKPKEINVGLVLAGSPSIMQFQVAEFESCTEVASVTSSCHCVVPTFFDYRDANGLKRCAMRVNIIPDKVRENGVELSVEITAFSKNGQVFRYIIQFVEASMARSGLTNMDSSND